MGHDRKFYFDHVFGPETTQSAVYTGCTLPLLKGFVEGYNATVLAYGQTGSGKTFTMGTDAECLAHSEFELIGILPRLVTDLYASIDKYVPRFHSPVLRLCLKNLNTVTSKLVCLLVRIITDKQGATGTKHEVNTFVARMGLMTLLCVCAIH